MTLRILLDSGVLGLLTHPHPAEESYACTAWLQARIGAGDEALISEVVDYELRREYLRRGSSIGLRKLDGWASQARFLPLLTPGWRLAAELWAWARNHGHITAPANDLNIDLLLAAQAQLLTAPGVEVVIATSNVRHLVPFADARLWTAI